MLLMLDMQYDSVERIQIDLKRLGVVEADKLDSLRCGVVNRVPHNTPLSRKLNSSEYTKIVVLQH